jgi:hypothetical protein
MCIRDRYKTTTIFIFKFSNWVYFLLFNFFYLIFVVFLYENDKKKTLKVGCIFFVEVVFKIIL